jgi:antirestriction protein
MNLKKINSKALPKEVKAVYDEVKTLTNNFDEEVVKNYQQEINDLKELLSAAPTEKPSAKKKTSFPTNKAQLISWLKDRIGKKIYVAKHPQRKNVGEELKIKKSQFTSSLFTNGAGEEWRIDYPKASEMTFSKSGFTIGPAEYVYSIKDVPAKRRQVSTSAKRTIERIKMSKGGYVRPSNSITTTGIFKFKTKDKEYTVISRLFERKNDTQDSLEIQDELRQELGSIDIQNSAWNRLSNGLPVKASSSKGNHSGVLVRIADLKDSIKFQKELSNQETELEVTKHGKIDGLPFEVISANASKRLVRVKNFSSGKEKTMPLKEWIPYTFEVGTPASFKHNGREVSGEVISRNGKMAISLYKDSNYAGSSPRVYFFDDIDLDTLQHFSPKEKFKSGGKVKKNRSRDMKFQSEEEWEKNYAKKRNLTRRRYQKKEAGGEIEKTPNPIIYVADLNAYNGGKLVGEHIDLSEYSSGAEVMEKIQELTDKWAKDSGETEVEYAIHDYEGFPKSLYHESMGEEDFDKIFELIEKSEETGIPFDVIEQWVDETGSEIDSIEDAYQGSADSEEDFAEDLVDQLGGPSNISNPNYYLYVSDIDRRLVAGEEQDRIREDLTEEGDLSEDEIEERSEEVYKEWYDGLEDPYSFLVEEQGLYDDESIMQASFVQFDYEAFARDLFINDYTSFRGADGLTYVFSNNYKAGGKVGSVKKKTNSNNVAASNAKFDEIMGDFATGKLKSSSGEVVTDKREAFAIAYNEARALSPSYYAGYGLGGLVFGMAAAGYIAYKIGRGMPQKHGFDTERKIGRAIGSRAKKTVSAIQRKEKGGRVSDRFNYIPAYDIESIETTDGKIHLFPLSGAYIGDERVVVNPDQLKLEFKAGGKLSDNAIYIPSYKIKNINLYHDEQKIPGTNVVNGFWIGLTDRDQQLLNEYYLSQASKKKGGSTLYSVEVRKKTGNGYWEVHTPNLTKSSAEKLVSELKKSGKYIEVQSNISLPFQLGGKVSSFPEETTMRIGSKVSFYYGRDNKVRSGYIIDDLGSGNVVISHSLGQSLIPFSKIISEQK